MVKRVSEHSLGLALALTAFVIWGVVPMFFKLLADVDPLLIISHRIFWSLLLIGTFLLFRDRRKIFEKLAVGSRVAAGLLLSGLLVAVNWLVFVWAVSNDQVLATSLGYFINPLVNMLLGMVILKERLNLSGWSAMLLAAFGTCYLGLYLGQAPWIALTLAFSFGVYGLMRKMLAVGPLIGLFWECLWLTPLVLLYILYWLPAHQATPISFFGPVLDSERLLLVISGPVTLAPLLLFVAATKRLPLTTIGFTQYLAPSISFCLAVFLYDEPFGHGHQVAFVCIWIALAIYTLGPRFSRRTAMQTDKT
jgi:chloramphenicol-sensitive protein RarD